jgi:hypothetical protein
MTDNTYNGWTNYATWRINLEVIDGLSLDDLGVDASFSVIDVAEAIHMYVDDVIFPDGLGNATLAETYAEAFLSDVNWREIASHKLEECAA